MVDIKNIAYGSLEGIRLLLRDYVYFANSVAHYFRGRSDLLICNSYPKSGTHLLSQILLKTGGGKYWNDILSVQSLSGRINTRNHIVWKYKSAPNKSVIRTHLPYSQDIKDILKERTHKSIFIYRDPRDIVCSHAHWVINEPRIYVHNYYKNVLRTHEERLNASIEGIHLGDLPYSNISMMGIVGEIKKWKGWLYDPDTLAIRFEDMVGERGGGSEERRMETIEKILNHIELEADRSRIEEEFASRKMNPSESHTFRKGQGGGIGKWKEVFTEYNKKVFKEEAGELLKDMGYEIDGKW